MAKQNGSGEPSVERSVVADTIGGIHGREVAVEAALGTAFLRILRQEVATATESCPAGDSCTPHVRRVYTLKDGKTHPGLLEARCSGIAEDRCAKLLGIATEAATGRINTLSKDVKNLIGKHTPAFVSLDKTETEPTE